ARGTGRGAGRRGEPLQVVVDGQSRTAADVLATVARSLEVVASHRTASLGDMLLLVSPMHARTIAADGWSKADVRRFLWERLEARRAGPSPKFRAPEHLKLIVAGGTPRPFTALIPGLPLAHSPAPMVLKKIALWVARGAGTIRAGDVSPRPSGPESRRISPLLLLAARGPGRQLDAKRGAGLARPAAHGLALQARVPRDTPVLACAPVL